LNILELPRIIFHLYSISRAICKTGKWRYK
jgi:hypothetical protein